MAVTVTAASDNVMALLTRLSELHSVVDALAGVSYVAHCVGGARSYENLRSGRAIAIAFRSFPPWLGEWPEHRHLTHGAHIHLALRDGRDNKGPSSLQHIV